MSPHASRTGTPGPVGIEDRTLSRSALRQAARARSTTVDASTPARPSRRRGGPRGRAPAVGRRRAELLRPPQGSPARRPRPRLASQCAWSRVRGGGRRGGVEQGRRADVGGGRRGTRAPLRLGARRRPRGARPLVRLRGAGPARGPMEAARAGGDLPLGRRGAVATDRWAARLDALRPCHPPGRGGVRRPSRRHADAVGRPRRELGAAARQSRPRASARGSGGVGESSEAGHAASPRDRRAIVRASRT